MPERTLLQFVGRLEILNAVASICMVVAMVIVCVLLIRQYDRLGIMERELTLRNEQGAKGLVLSDERNAQGAAQIKLLEEALRRLDR